MNRVLDMILAGRPVSGEEAFVMGLANRLVERGKAREEAESFQAFPCRSAETPSLKGDNFAILWYETMAMGAY
jgi:enoyl-CoA hydratase